MLTSTLTALIELSARDELGIHVIVTNSMQKSPLILVAAAALVREDGCLLLAQRPEGKSMAGLWEFPGGKVEAGERPEDALARELEEELGLETDASDFSPFAFASHAYDAFHLLMPVFLCRRWRGEPKGLEGQELSWVSAADAKTYPTPPADVSLMERFAEWSAARTGS